MKSLKFIMILFLLSTISCAQKQVQELKEEVFLNPNQEHKMYTFWQWMDGMITKEGISRDLVAMKSQGITQAGIFCVGLNNNTKDFGIPKVGFATESWFQMFRWTLQEAKRLGITIGMHNSNGWSGSGGPWITPELSMKKYIWTKAMVEGGKTIQLELKKPLGLHNFYRDVAVVAMKSNQNPGYLKLNIPEIILNGKTNASALFDGSPISAITLRKGDTIDFRSSSFVNFNKIALYPYHSSMWGDPENFRYSFRMFAAIDNGNLQPITNFSIKGANRLSTITLKPIKTRHVRFVITDSRNNQFQVPANLGELELLDTLENPLFDPAIPDFLEKSAFVRSKQEQYFTGYDDNRKFQETFSNDVIDITNQMDSSGFLRWEAPPGDWTILRFGYTTTGAVNNPVSSDEAGLECDKMDSTALNFHFKNFPEKLIRNAGSYTGNTFKFLFSDSYECSYMNWTVAFPAEFEKQTGYSIIPWIPVLCGETVGSQYESESFLYDFRKTIAQLIEENYYKHLSNLCHRNKLEFHSEVMYGNYSYPPLDILKTNKYIDFPMSEFWTTSDTNANIRYNPNVRNEIHLPVSAGKAYGKSIVAAEAYTGLANYSESLSDLKPFGDRAFCEGINQFVLHSYVHQPDEQKPGMTLGRYASHFNRHNLYWPYMKEWIDYQLRIQYVLQQGSTVADVLYYLGDQLPQFNYSNNCNNLPFGFQLTSCNFDILKNRIQILKNKIILNEKDTLALLSISPFQHMNIETLRELDSLVRAGCNIYSPKPLYTLNHKDFKYNRSEFAKIANKMWGEGQKEQIDNRHGKGRVFWGMPIKQSLKEIGILPDFATSPKDSNSFRYIHKKYGDTDIYFVANQLNESVQTELFFRVVGKRPEIWDAENGTILYPGMFHSEQGLTRIPLYFSAYKSLFLVFKRDKSNEFITSISRDGKTLFPNPLNSEQLPFFHNTDNGIIASNGSKGVYKLVTHKNKILNYEIASEKVYVINDFTGEISFEPAYPCKIPIVTINRLKPFSEFSDPSIRYFAGDARYTITFRNPLQFSVAGKTVFLDIGKFESAATVTFNGIPMGKFWRSEDLQMDVSRFLLPINLLQVTVTNLYRNRFIGDFVQYGRRSNLWTTAPIEEFLNKNKPLHSSGLTGPIKLTMQN